MAVLLCILLLSLVSSILGAPFTATPSTFTEVLTTVSNGDSISLTEGIFLMDPQLMTKNLSLVGAGPGTVIKSPNYSVGIAFSFLFQSYISVNIQNMTITGYGKAIDTGDYGENFVSGVTFINNTLQAISNTAKSSSYTITNCNFYNNGQGPGTYGIVELNSPGSVNYISNCTFSGNWYGFGCLTLTNISETTTVENCTFTDGYASDGGAILLHNSNAIVTNSIFTNNQAEQHGPAAFIYETSTLVFQNCRFENHTTQAQGVFSVESSSSLTIQNSNIQNNKAPFLALIYVDYSSVTIQDSILANNSGDYGFQLKNFSSASLHNVSASFAPATYGIYNGGVAPAQVSIDNCTLFGSSSTGIQMQSTGSYLNLTNSDIHSIGSFGIDISENAFVSMSNTNVYDCHYGVYLDQSQGSITGGTISGNSVNGIEISYAGGPIYITGVNLSKNNGSAINIQNSAVTISSCYISGNSAANKGAGIYQKSGNLRIFNTTVSYNSLTQEGQGGGIYVESYFQLTINGSHIIQNNASAGAGIYLVPLVGASTTNISNTQILDNIGDGIFIDQINNTLVESSVNISQVTITNTNASSMIFCCDGSALDSVADQVCNFPACGGCQGSSIYGCDCTVPLPCVCQSGFTGHNCVDDIDECALDTFSCPTNATCNNTRGGYACTCPPGYVSNGTDCIDFNECDNSPCDVNAFCENLIGSYNCTCHPFFSGNGKICNDINECQGTYNGNCTLFSQCQNYVGGFFCPCNEGYFQNGSICSPFCGDSNCDPSRNETCVSCPQDCKNSTCMVCNDGFCDTSIENCTTCPNDCGVCVPVISCGGSPVCNGHGNCNNLGVCDCVDSWTGPLCNTDQLVPITVQSNPNNTVISFATSQLNFSITVTRIVEYQGNSNNEVQVILLSDSNYGFTPSTNVDSSRNQKWVYNSTLFNRAIFNMTIELFGEISTPYPFAGITRNFPKNSLKLNMAIENWPFSRAGNTLGIDINVGNNNAAPLCTDNHQTGESLNWLTISYNSGTLYGQFLQAAVLDGRVQNITYKSNQNTITAVVPHFWDFAEIDPDFSVLLLSKKTDPCTGKITRGKSNTTLIIAIVVPVVVGAIILALGIAYWTKIHMKKHVRAHRRNVKLEPVPSEPARDSIRL